MLKAVKTYKHNSIVIHIHLAFNEINSYLIPPSISESKLLISILFKKINVLTEQMYGINISDYPWVISVTGNASSLSSIVMS